METSDIHSNSETHTEEPKKDFRITLLKVGIGAAIIGGTTYGLYKLYEHHVKTNAEKDVLKKPEVQQAETLRAALFRSGIDWALHFGTSNNDAVMSIASSITDFDAVQAEYKNLYSSDLQDDLREKLGAEGLQKFLNTLNYNPNTVENKGNGKSGKGKTIGLPAHSIVVTKAKANIRRTPKDTSRWSLHSNIIQLVEQGTFLGESTGKTAFDNNGASDTGTLYVEIRTVALDTRKAVFFWVAASQVKAITYAEYKATEPPLVHVQEKDTLNGIADLQKHIVTRLPAPIMNSDFKPVAIAKPMQSLGYEIMSLNTGAEEYIKFLSEGQKEYWVNKKFVQII